MRLTLFLKSVN